MNAGLGFELHHQGSSELPAGIVNCEPSVVRGWPARVPARPCAQDGAITWMYREDYARAGFPMLAVLEPDGRSTGRRAAYASAKGGSHGETDPDVQQ